ncbi:GGDEF domain-containing protein [Spirochaeta dissipatitropha]
MMSAWFHRSRPFFASLIILILVLVFHSPQIAFFTDFSNSAVFDLLRLTVPVYIVLIALSPKRRILGGVSLIWILLIALIWLLSWGTQHYDWLQGFIRSVHSLNFLPVPLSLLPMTDLSALIGVLGFVCIILAVPVHRTDTQLSVAWIGTYLALETALIYMENSSIALVWLAASGTVLVTGLIQHAHSMAYLDELTTVPNRRALEEQLQRLRQKYSIAMVDIDHFKQFNDTYGHRIGDQALKKTAVQLLKVEGGGRVYRYGGEEFTIIFPGKDSKAAAACCDSIRRQIEKDPFTKRSTRTWKSPRNREIRTETGKHEGIVITVSIGVSESNSKSANPQQVLQNADKALYAAKKKGRNRVVIASSNLHNPIG